MNLFWQSVFSNALLAGILAGVVAIVCRFVRRPALAHGLWLLVLVKLLTPPVLMLRLGLIAPTDLGGFGSYLLLLLTVIWLVGSIFLFVVTVLRVGQFQRLLSLARPAPDRLQRKVYSMAQRLGLTKIPTVWLIPGSLPPLVWSVGAEPRVYLPTDLLGRLPAAQRGTLLAHELAHLVRGDHWIRWIEAAATIAFWWHPVVWIAARELREAEEQCCDAWVVQAYPNSSRDYADALLETIDFLSEPQQLLQPQLAAAASAVTRIHDLETRLVMVMQGTDGKALSRNDWWALVVATAIIIPVGLSMASSSSQSSQESQTASAVSHNQRATTSSSSLRN